MAQLTDLAKATAVKYGLDPALVCAVCEHESSWNTFAIRYEPGFFHRYIEPQRGLTPTEAYSRAFSYGLMQVMGQVARELGYSGRFVSSLLDPEIGLDFGCKKLARCAAQSGGSVHDALQRYNGGADSNYAPTVMALISKYQ
jgi:soluble lytic murein transglycosylase-like protein